MLIKNLFSVFKSEKVQSFLKCSYIRNYSKTRGDKHKCLSKFSKLGRRVVLHRKLFALRLYFFFNLSRRLRDKLNCNTVFITWYCFFILK